MPSDFPAVIVAGHICLDVIPTFGAGAEQLEALLVPGKLVEVGPPVVATGGAVSNTGLALHRLGVPVRLMGKVGDDLFGQAVLDVLRGHADALAEGMIVAPREPTSYTVVVNPPGVDRIFLHCPGANDTFRPDEVRMDRLAGARLFHFGYPPLMRLTFEDGGSGLASLFSAVRRQGLAVSLDMARPDPASAAGRTDWAAWLHRVLPHVDFFGPSFDELLFMLDRPRYDRMAREAGPEDLTARLDGALLAALSDRLLAMGAAVVALKLGAEGLYLRTTDDPQRLAGIPGLSIGQGQEWRGRMLLHPCFRAEVAGTTGSGDCTLAGFLAGLLHGHPPEDTLTDAVAVGACSVEQADSTSGVPPWADVQERIRAGWPQRPTAANLPGWQWDDRHGLWIGPEDRLRIEDEITEDGA